MSGRPPRVRAKRLLSDQLAQFETPKTWEEIFKLAPRMLQVEWRDCIARADERGEGFLRWDTKTKTWRITAKGRAFVALMREKIVGAFKIQVDAIGNHGCQRERVDGDTVYGCGSMNCPDCLTSEYIAKMRRAGVLMTSAVITHWPGQPTQVTDEYQLADLPVLPLAKRSRRGKF